jgi:hypothetical protein
MRPSTPATPLGRAQWANGSINRLHSASGRHRAAILHLIADHRVFTTDQLAAVFFSSQDRAEHRLRQLTQAGVLARFRPHTRHGEGSAPYHYVLGPLAAARHRRAHAGPRAALVVWWSERRCADHWGRLVRPDGYGRWREDDREVDFFLEYDRGTEPLDRLAAKLAGYQQLADATRIATPVLFWLPNTGREATVRQALAGQTRWASVPFLVATASPALGRSPAEQVWLPLGHTWPRRCLIDLPDVDQSSDEVPPSSVRS